MRLGASFLAAWLMTASFALARSPAQDETRPMPAPSQEYCITAMSSFPSDDPVARYQFFKLTQELSTGATPELRQLLGHYGDAQVNAQTPILDVIESIANPVLRQAAPELIIGYMNHLIDFSSRCETFVSGQVKSLMAFKPNLVDSDKVIAEDALFLKQILSESIQRAGADTDPAYAPTSRVYAQSLVRTRNNIEFKEFDADIDELEALYMSDLDGRLARSNDLINEEVNTETLGDAVTLSDDMNSDLKRKEDQAMLETLFRILNRY